MENEIKLMNKYYPWREVRLNGIRYYLKGNVFFNNKLLSLEKLADLLYPLISGEKNKEKEIGKFLKELNGQFSVVAESENRIFCAVDKLRSVPLFYTISKNSFIVSDNAYYLKEKISQPLNEKNAAEFLVAGYVTGNETLFDDIKQMRNSELIIYQKKENILKTVEYFRFLHENYYKLPEDELLEILDQIFVNAFTRLIESTQKQGKKLVVPLSGGLDSRIVIAMLKRLGVDDVICISYGRKGNRESKISKKVAKALGYDWLFIEYTAQKWRECYNSAEGDQYRIFAGNLSSLPHMQDFLTVQELRNQGKIPDNSVFIPGHTGDMLAGSHIPHYYLDNSRNYNSEIFLIDSLKRHYNLWKWPADCELEQAFKEKINKSTAEMEINNSETCASAIELFDFNERQAKFIVNAVRVYEFFGYEWRIPLWDMELVNFFLKIPIEHRINQKLYRKYARDMLFSEELSILKDIDCTLDIHNLKPLEERSKYEKLLYYRTFIHSYYDEVIANPIWGRYFKNPLISRILTRISRYDNKGIEEYPLLETIVEYRNEKKFPLSINGISSLEYLAGIKGENYASIDRNGSETNKFSSEKLSQITEYESKKNAKVE